MEITILDTILEADFGDADFMENMETAFADMSEKINNLELNAMKPSEAIRKECQAVYDLFDDIFGKDTGDAVFEGKMNVELCLKAMDQLYEAKDNTTSPEMKLLVKKFENRAQQKSGNRAQRRAAAKIASKKSTVRAIREDDEES